MARWQVEYTDTFGGEANYAWVVRQEFRADENAPRATLVRKAKRMLGMSGIPAKVEQWYDGYRLTPRGMNTVAFIEFIDHN
jgi:hypothetical protein